MKNPIIKMLALALCLFLASCNQNNFSGSYSHTGDFLGKETTDTFDFNMDGTVVWTDFVGGIETGHYTVNGNEITATFPDNAPVTFTREGDALIRGNGFRYVRAGQ